MNVGMNADWARFKKLGIERLGRPGFAEWLDHAAEVVRTEAKREAANAAHLAANGKHMTLVGSHPEVST